MEENQSTVRPLYGKVVYDLLDQLDVSALEYLYLDMMYQLSHSRWCTKPLQSIADDLRMSKSGMHYVKRRMIEKGLIEENGLHHVRTTRKYNDLQLTDRGSVQKVNKPVDNRSKIEQGGAKIEQGGAKIAPKSYKRLTRDYKALPVDNSERSSPKTYAGGAKAFPGSILNERPRAVFNVN